MNKLQTSQRLRKVKLYGKLATICGTDEVEVSGDNVRVLVSGLVSRFGDEVKEHIRENNWNIFLGDIDQEKSLSEDSIDWQLGEVDELHLFPHTEGAGRVGQIIAGIVLIIAGVTLMVTSWGADGGIGWAGVTQGAALIMAGGNLIMTAGMHNSRQRENPDERASYIFNGAVNTVEQGGPVPLCYGRFKVGSTIVSAGIDAEQLAIINGGDPSGGGGGIGNGPYPIDPEILPH